MKKIVSVVLPTYNEKANIEGTIKKVLEQEKYLPDYEINIIIADDVRSSDGIEQIAKELVKKGHDVHVITSNLDRNSLIKKEFEIGMKDFNIGIGDLELEFYGAKIFIKEKIEI